MVPATEAALSEVLSDAAGRGAPVEIVGGGSRAGIGRPVQVERTLSTAGISGIQLYEPGALTLVVRAGTPMAEIDAALEAEAQMLPFEPMDHRALLGTVGEPTIGGAVAVAASGPRRLQKGACRDAMIGTRFVDGSGRIVSNGGRVMKNVTGVDLVKLMAGSHGTLGVLSEISFKLLPAPEAETTLIIRGQDPVAGVAALSAALGSPFEVSGAAYAEAGILADEAMTLLRIEGLEGAVQYRAQNLRRPDWDEIDAADSRALWRRIRDVEPFAGSLDAVWRLSVKPSHGPMVSQALRDAGLAHSVLYDWGGGLLWLALAADRTGDAGAQLIRAQVASFGGHATLVRAPAAVRAAVDVFQPEDPVVSRLSEALRVRFDPARILNPGRMRA